MRIAACLTVFVMACHAGSGSSTPPQSEPAEQNREPTRPQPQDDLPRPEAPPVQPAPPPRLVGVWRPGSSLVLLDDSGVATRLEDLEPGRAVLVFGRSSWSDWSDIAQLRGDETDFLGLRRRQEQDGLSDPRTLGFVFNEAQWALAHALERQQRAGSGYVVLANDEQRLAARCAGQPPLAEDSAFEPQVRSDTIRPGDATAAVMLVPVDAWLAFGTCRDSVTAACFRRGVQIDCAQGS